MFWKGMNRNTKANKQANRLKLAFAAFFELVHRNKDRVVDEASETCY